MTRKVDFYVVVVCGLIFIKIYIWVYLFSKHLFFLSGCFLAMFVCISICFYYLFDFTTCIAVLQKPENVTTPQGWPFCDFLCTYFLSFVINFITSLAYKLCLDLPRFIAACFVNVRYLHWSSVLTSAQRKPSLHFITRHLYRFFCEYCKAISFQFTIH